VWHTHDQRAPARVGQLVPTDATLRPIIGHGDINMHARKVVTNPLTLIDATATHAPRHPASL